MGDNKFLGVPYDLRLPTWKRIKERCWNPKDSRIITPKVFGAGWTINWYQIIKKLGLLNLLDNKSKK